MTNYFEITPKLQLNKNGKNWTINGKNYRNARRRNYCYYGNGECWRRNK